MDRAPKGQRSIALGNAQGVRKPSIVQALKGRYRPNRHGKSTPKNERVPRHFGWENVIRRNNLSASPFQGYWVKATGSQDVALSYAALALRAE